MGSAGEGGQFGRGREQEGSLRGEDLAPDKRSQFPGCRVHADRWPEGVCPWAVHGSSHKPHGDPEPLRQHGAARSEEAGLGKKKERKRPQLCFLSDCMWKCGAE